MPGFNTIGDFQEWLVKQVKRGCCIEAQAGDIAWAHWVCDLQEKNLALTKELNKLKKGSKNAKRSKAH